MSDPQALRAMFDPQNMTAMLQAVQQMEALRVGSLGRGKGGWLKLRAAVGGKRAGQLQAVQQTGALRVGARARVRAGGSGGGQR